MIELSFQQTLIGAGLPAHRRTINNYSCVFKIIADPASISFALEARYLQAFAQLLHYRRKGIDWSEYPRTANRCRFDEGNSYVRNESEGRRIKAVNLHFSDIENETAKYGPTAIRPYHVAGFARDIKALAPDLVVFDDSINDLFENEILVRPLMVSGSRGAVRFTL